MSLRSILPEIVSFVESQRERLQTEKNLYDAYEGGLLKQVDAILRNQLGKRSAQEAIERMPPINILRKLVTKLSTLYVDPPTRTPLNESDKDLIKSYCEEMNLDSYMYDANIFFNLHRRVALEPYLEDGKPKIRAIPGHLFLVYSDDRVNPTRPTVFIKFMGTVLIKDQKTGKDEPTDILWLYTDNEFLSITSRGEIYGPDMAGNDGVNPYGKIPFVYINSSRYNLLPEPDSELLRMTLLVPILYSDINFGAKYQVFSIVYGIDINMENLEYGPNALWSFKSDEDGRKPEVGSIKPEVDIEAMTQSITNQLAVFFETRNLRGSTISGFAGGRYGQQDSGGQTGAALLIQNLDTTEIRKSHTKIFAEAEYKMWKLIAEAMHPYWVGNGETDISGLFSVDSKVKVEYTPEYELKSDMDLVTELQQKLNSGLISRKMALSQLYPHMREDEIEQLMEDIEMDAMSGVVNGQQSVDGAVDSGTEQTVQQSEDESSSEAG